VLEDIANRLAAIRQPLRPEVSSRRIYVVAADHGVVAEGVSAYPREVTAQMVYNFLRGGAAINALARHVGIEGGKGPTCGRILRPAIREVKRKAKHGFEVKSEPVTKAIGLG